MPSHAKSSPGGRIARTDSKLAESTCHGLNGKGNHCRNAIAVAKGPSSGPVIDLSDEALYCWQHKDQAGQHAAPSSSGPSSRPKPKPQGATPKPQGTTIVVDRVSLDTLADRLGFMAIHDPAPSPAAIIPNFGGYNNKKKKKKKKRSSLWCCCISLPSFDEEDEFPEPPRPHQQQQQHSASRPPSHARKNIPQELIPRTLPPKTISVLEKEVAEGFSPADKPGYIYIFWLVDKDAKRPMPAVSTVRDMMLPGNGHGRTRDTDTGTWNDDPANHHSTDSTLLLKIGRTNNVDRRMTEWKKQCRYDIELLRFYPHVPSSMLNGTTGNGEARATPHANKVENLIHKELTGMGMRAKFAACEHCGKEHREWFTMEFTRASVQKVDEVIRKWIEWDALSSR